MIRTNCAHCRSPYMRDPDDDGPDAYLCPDCADAAVLGEPCAICRRLPGRRPCQPDPEPRLPDAASARVRYLGGMTP